MQAERQIPFHENDFAPTRHQYPWFPYEKAQNPYPTVGRFLLRGYPDWYPCWWRGRANALALSVAAYGNPYARKSGDIDQLICRSDIDEVKQLLLDQGFVQGRVTANGIQPFSQRELHTAAQGNPLCRPLSQSQTSTFLRSLGLVIWPTGSLKIPLPISISEYVLLFNAEPKTQNL